MHVQVKVPNLQPRYYHGAAAFNIAPGLTEIVVFGGCPVNNDAEVIAKTTVLRFGECVDCTAKAYKNC